MKYKDLIQFDPINSIIHLTEANEKSEAEKLVKTFVMSDSMAGSLDEIVIQHLQFEEVVDNKGIFIVGNYGTGKSHLMSVISALAEDKAMLEHIKNGKFKRDGERIAGKFEVLRFEIGATTMSLRDIILTNIEEDLANRGINYAFTPAHKVTDNKTYIMEMMSIFEEKYPDKGYLIVIDELLDYLKRRNTMELRFDLGFLRELGEVCKHSRFRIMSGVQEALFDNPNFEFVASTLFTVKDRYIQMVIHREDITYVVSERLLQKDEKQKAWIREHLEKFSFLYKNMWDRLEEYIDLFPIHPAYFETFEKLYLIEKRHVLITITHIMKKLLDKEVPEDETGLISYDSYWEYLKGDATNKTIPEVKEVIEKSSQLEGIIEHSFTKPIYKPMALRIIHALSVNRLTKDDIYSPLGITVENMKDDLCLFDPSIPEMEEDFLTTQITTVMREISKTVSGQFIEYNKENEQYFLNLKKNIDYNVKVQQAAESLDPESLNRYYFDLILKAMEFDRAVRVNGFDIWEYEIMWESKNIEREGYLFFGGPDDRPTAQPPRDFYIYFMPPYGKVREYNFDREDEVFILLDNTNEEIKELISLYGGALLMEERSSGESKLEYGNKAEEYKKQVIEWLNHNINQCFTVRYEAIDYNILSLLKGKRIADRTLKEIIDLAASICLNTYFNEKYPDIPVFKLPITKENTNENFRQGLIYLAGNRTEAGEKLLDSFGLLDGGKIVIENSICARYYQDLVSKLEGNKVINKEDIIEEVNGIEIDRKFKMDSIWTVLILSSLIYSGELILKTAGIEFNANNMRELAKENTQNLIDFKYISRPKDLPLPVLRKIFEFLDLAPGTIVSPQKREKAVADMLKANQQLLVEITQAQHFVNGDIKIWGKDSIESQKVEEYKEGLKDLRNFCDRLSAFNTLAKLKNMDFIIKDIEAQEENQKIIHVLSKVEKLRDTLKDNTQYLSNAESISQDEEWKEDIKEVKNKLNEILIDLDSIDDNTIREFELQLVSLKKQYIKNYMELHKKYRLSITEDNRKKEIMKSNKWESLNRLSAINNIFPMKRYRDIIDKISRLQTCFTLKESDLESNHICNQCGFNPKTSEKPIYGVLDEVEEDIDQLYDNFTNILLENIEDPMIKGNIPYLEQSQQDNINRFLEERELPEYIENDFITGVNILLSGIEKIELTSEEIANAITGNSSITIENLKRNFDKFIDNLTKGKDESKIRIIIK